MRKIRYSGLNIQEVMPEEVDRKWKRVVDYVSGLAACVTRRHSGRELRRAVRGRPSVQSAPLLQPST